MERIDFVYIGMRRIYTFLVAILLVFIGLIEGDGSIVIALATFYLLGVLFAVHILDNQNGMARTMYDLFFFIYILFAFLTSLELIHNPNVDYFVHYDASHNFYAPFLNTARETNWGTVIENTLFDYQYYDRPLTALISVVIIKIASYIGVEDLRFLLRSLVCVHASLIPAAIAGIMSKYGFKKKEILRAVLPFGFFSYLLITSGIFTRDLYICFFYTMTTYVFLLPHCKFRWFWFIIIYFLTIGHRQENGILLLTYVFGYYFTTKRSKYGLLIYLILTFAILFVAYEIRDSILALEDTLTRYELRTQSNVGGVFQRVYSLPFPINTIAMIIYLLIMPLPLTLYITGEGGTWLTLPFALSPYLMSLLFVSTFWYVKKHIKLMNKEVVLILISFLSFSCITYGSPDLRRSFAAVPGLYMVYCLILPKVPNSIFDRTKMFVWPLIIIINIIFLIYTIK